MLCDQFIPRLKDIIQKHLQPYVSVYHDKFFVEFRYLKLENVQSKNDQHGTIITTVKLTKENPQKS